jgi:N-acetylgalactosamine-N,N'-diacetylbacillosaminyl-diphospho-undecaprenol 4-alpha-N-acetylgalactosaminyltransferase
MACGLPVVATNCASGPSEILLDKAREAVEGLVPCAAGAVVPTNDALAFAEALRLVHDPATRAGRGRAASAITRKFDIVPTTGRYWETIEKTLAGTRRRPLLMHGNGIATSGQIS